MIPPVPKALRYDFDTREEAAPSSTHDSGSTRTGMIRSVITLYPDTRREHDPAVPHACELPPRQRPRRLPRPSPPRPRTRFLPQATRPHSPNPRVGRWTIPANLPIARPPALPVPPVRMPPYSRFGFSPGPV